MSEFHPFPIETGSLVDASLQAHWALQPSLLPMEKQSAGTLENSVVVAASEFLSSPRARLNWLNTNGTTKSPK